MEVFMSGYIPKMTSILKEQVASIPKDNPRKQIQSKLEVFRSKLKIMLKSELETMLPEPMYHF